jgi:plastocyanin
MRKTQVLPALALAMAAGLVGRAGAYEATTVTNGGKLSGTVKYDGTPPPPAKLEVTKDPEVCGKEKVSPDLVVGSGGVLANVVVTVKATKGKALDASKPVQFDQKQCEYHPHVLVVPAGGTVEVLNSDGILHNIHTFSTVNPPQNQAQPKFKPKIQLKVEKPELVNVKCDVHGWMSAYWDVTDNPYVAVTDSNGAFTIADIPPGDYDVELWQEKLGKKTDKVSIKAGEEAKAAWMMGK